MVQILCWLSTFSTNEGSIRFTDFMSAVEESVQKYREAVHLGSGVKHV